MEVETKQLIRFYTITSELGNMVYVGSTNKAIQKRFNGHLSSYNGFKNPRPNRIINRVTSYLLFDEYSVENCKRTCLSC